ncbi:hypothetical protein BATDEDRAFT_36590 [Batrachochytrium dendrobatidis JAM81]|uniref:t-SNARE coiled-coil homology domain-containing protein n=2 Tax=Batrachochytrium dendrobatidis TaxID=109871 RepID=F4NXD0_BATDJ|nr:uncharacterized protein BATDEDRAFT_36590 [Batrachochytrium dendrobatidis JAM81]EGF82656.1 hypothetical protein BATDEDRAFT_36590 [Batrachochytrium dendrobatidis JAM81]KAJ8328408.1 SNAP receptor [Batrachochytrium dendrobatidis]KAK5673467.1 SNAP receptor activity protein [Batrachochytrium dendrobatidis]OAJ39936.1 hypothetical protein BDEG_23730 [Batrachochytrium dendrobatidis JEL423]|eukprot:XP_006676839.1 hypothetical protein BATDEDRAFT_36590 [Batrachochytrium dendrobatidis JAM81]
MSYTSRGSSRGSSRQESPHRSAQSSSRSNHPQNAHSRDAGGGTRWTAAAAAAERSHNDPNGTSSRWRQDQEDWDSSEWLQEKTKEVQGESLSSTRRALQRLNETQTTAEKNMGMMNQQSEQLHKIELRIDVAENQAKVNDAKVDHLKAVNRFFLIPSFGKGKAKRREKKLKDAIDEGKTTTKSSKEREAQWEEHNNRKAEFQSKYDARPNGPAGAASGNNSRYERIYTTPQGVDRDDVEVELDSNLNDISSGLSRLKMMGMAMNSELDSQSQQMNRIHDRTDASRDYMGRLNNKMDHFAPRNRK